MFLAPPKIDARDRVAILRDRAHCFQEVRQFFSERAVLEVDCPLLTQAASIDAHIDLLPALYRGQETRYLITSPEYGMKRLLSEGMGDIYQLGHVFRDGERGSLHNPEFTMIEWYRIGFSFAEMIDETAELIMRLIGERPKETLSYREAVLRYTGLDPYSCPLSALQNLVCSEDADRDSLLNIALGTLVEPQLGRGVLTLLTHYPATQAALAKKIRIDGYDVAERFEIYANGLELANGYHELTNAQEQRERFHESNEARKALGKKAFPLDEHFLTALHKGIPDCCGVAVGFDRLMILRHGLTAIDSVIPFVWEKA